MADVAVAEARRWVNRSLRPGYRGMWRCQWTADARDREPTGVSPALRAGPVVERSSGGSRWVELVENGSAVGNAEDPQ